MVTIIVARLLLASHGDRNCSLVKIKLLNQWVVGRIGGGGLQPPAAAIKGRILGTSSSRHGECHLESSGREYANFIVFTPEQLKIACRILNESTGEGFVLEVTD